MLEPSYQTYQLAGLGKVAQSSYVLVSASLKEDNNSAHLQDVWGVNELTYIKNQQYLS